MTKRKGYDDSQTLRVRGLEGIFSGRECRVRLGETVTIGRSRECDFYPGGADGESPLLGKMSRKHLRISFCNPEHIEIEDLSRNGTFLNGKRIDRMVLRDVRRVPAVLDILAGTVSVEFASVQEGSSHS